MGYSIITTINPATGETLAQYSCHTTDEVNARLDSLHHGWEKWKNLSFKERGKYFIALGKKLLDKKEEYARLITTEMGKPIRFARAEIEKCAWICEYFAKNAEKHLHSEVVQTSLKKSSIHYIPMGTILGVMPWNYPFWQVFRAMTTSMMAGNVFLLKHAPISTGASLAIEALWAEIAPMTVFRSVILDEASVSSLIGHNQIAGVTLTGSVRAGKSVAGYAAKALKKCVLELGGSDPYVILSDADIPTAAKLCVRGRLTNSGQVCIAPKRLIIVDSVYAAFRACVLENVNSYSYGDPLREETIFGPLARADLRNTAAEQVQKSLAQGATLLVGGEMPAEKGFYYPATVLENVMPGMIAFDEEVFGPVITLIRAKDEEDAIRLANHSPYGLGAGIFTQDLKRGEYLATYCIEAGACYVNGIVSSDPRLPFGGVKTSGLGYELGAAGLREFTHIKTVGIA